jgi:hypothetical protein
MRCALRPCALCRLMNVWQRCTDFGLVLALQDALGTKVKIRLRGGRAKEEGRVEVKIGENSRWP